MNQELIDATIALCDSVDPSGKIAKHLDLPPDSPMSPHELGEWILYVYEVIDEQARLNRERFWEFANAVRDGDEVAFDIADNLTAELASEFNNKDADE